MTRNFSKSQISDYVSALALASRPPGLRTVLVALDEFREVVAKAAHDSFMDRLASPPITTVPVLYLKTYLDNLSRDLLRQAQPTCDCCCHYQAHPPRCQLSKRSISPKQFSCKKYSPKYNSRK